MVAHLRRRVSLHPEVSLPPTGAAINSRLLLIYTGVRIHHLPMEGIRRLLTEVIRHPTEAI